MSESWYVRRNGMVKGPFPGRLVAHLVAEHKLRATDELSRDRSTWRPVAVLRAEIAGTGEERPRGPAPGRAVPVGAAVPEPAGPKVRPAAPGAGRRRDWRRSYLARARLSRARRAGQVAVLVSAVFAVFVAGFALDSGRRASAPDCAAPAAPGVNWSNCRLEALGAARADLSGALLRSARLRDAELLGAVLTAADLAYAELIGANLSYASLAGAVLLGANLQRADLSYADLRGADLAYADLSGANLGGADLSGARLDNAIWLDGRVCGAGSAGVCRRDPTRNPPET